MLTRWPLVFGGKRSSLLTCLSLSRFLSLSTVLSTSAVSYAISLFLLPPSFSIDPYLLSKCLNCSPHRGCSGTIRRHLS